MKNKILLSITLLTFLPICLVNAQLKIVNTGKVGVGLSETTDPVSSLSIGGAGLNTAKLYVFNSGSNDTCQYGTYSAITAGTTTNCWKYGIAGSSRALSGYVVGVKGNAGPVNTHMRSVHAYGVYGSASNANYGRNYGIYGVLPNGDFYGTGVYGTNDNTEPTFSERYAGFFRGKTEVNGDFYATTMTNTSDARLKTNIMNIQPATLQKIKDLRPIQFQWQQVEDIIVEDTVTTKTPHFSEETDFKRTHYGLLAQDVQKLFPELVQEKGDGYLGVNYVELIPLLIQSIQELSAKIEDQDKQIKALQSKR